MELNKIHTVYFLGIGGIGMSALARYFKTHGKNVCGYDKTETALTTELILEGMDIHFTDNIRYIPLSVKQLPYDLENILVVYTPAIPKEQSELVFFEMNGFTIKKRSEVLGMISDNSRTIAVAGTHGKTTTSTLIAHILKVANLQPSAFLGGISQNYNTNLLLNTNSNNSQLPTPNSQLMVVEADEYDRSFLTLHPEIAIITSVDADHLDIYGSEKYMHESYSLFANQVKDKLILKKSIVSKIATDKKVITYSVDDEMSTYFSQHITINNGEYHFEIVTPNFIFQNLTIGLPGLHNVENAVAATAVACEMGIPEAEIREALKTFGGVKRRFEYQIKTEKLIFIDDYAHHPEELKATINSVKQMYSGKKITGIFQPHLYSRTRDLADEFARSLDLLDECILMEIYPARELPMVGVSSEMLLNRMKSKNKMICTKENLMDEITNRNVEVLLTLGAGDIDTLVHPIKNKLIEIE